MTHLSRAPRPGRPFGRRAGKALLTLLLPMALLLGAAPAFASSIIVKIEGVHSDKGEVVVALFNRAEQFPDGDYSIRHTAVRASTKPIVVTFDDLPPGTYAVGAYHDENDNHKFDTNFIGYPVEGYALSRGVRAVISRPRFIDAAFTVGEGSKDVVLHIGY